ncbi:uncharacterized protein [Aegilops tauschii subsp. strangulata]|uniref:uncharacterized protein n=1 Tax=Aegilops tauschii subsp. strangulata TaxID=200361 RepID=UPI003CC83A4B
MVAVKISNEPTFCIKNMILEHTCPTQSEKTRISSKWLGNKMLETIRSDPNTTIPAIVDKAKRQFGVEVPKMMAWRAKRKAKVIVLGDHKRKYKRLRDYLKTVKARNPGSRCIVSTRAGFRGEDLKKCMDAGAYAYTEHDFLLAMESKNTECQAAWEWMSRIPPKDWSRHAMDTNCKTDLVVNNLSEVFNKYILDVRNKPIVTMINGVKDKFLVRYQQTREGGLVSTWEIAPTYAEKLEMNKRYARDYKSLIVGPGLFQVSSGDKTYSVDTNLKTCGCKKWDISGFPCNHGCSAIYMSKQLPEDHVNVFFKKAMYLE